MSDVGVGCGEGCTEISPISPPMDKVQRGEEADTRNDALEGLTMVKRKLQSTTTTVFPRNAQEYVYVYPLRRDVFLKKPPTTVVVLFRCLPNGPRLPPQETGGSLLCALMSA